MEAYQLRVVHEQAELSDRVTKLVAFIESARFQTVPLEERARLHKQLSGMLHYDEALKERIAEFPPSNFPPTPVPPDHSSLSLDLVADWFTYHSPTPEQMVSYTKIREAGQHMALVVDRHVPHGADKSAAMRKIREAVMTANAGVACEVR